MGTLSTHRCTSCGLSGVVSWGPDVGFFASTDTFYCTGCELLQDIQTGLTPWAASKAPRGSRFLEPPPPVACKQCHVGLDSTDPARRLIKLDKKAPCPRCGGQIQSGSDWVMWD